MKAQKTCAPVWLKWLVEHVVPLLKNVIAFLEGLQAAWENQPQTPEPTAA